MRDTDNIPVMSGGSRRSKVVDSLRTDGGVELEPPPIEPSRAYSRALRQLTATGRAVRSDAESVDRSRVVQQVAQFLGLDHHGSGYVSGLVTTARLTVHFRIHEDDVGEVRVPRSPADDIVAWCLDLTGRDADDPLADEAFEFCRGREEWHEILVDAVEIHGSAVPLTDDQLTTLASTDPGELPVAAFVDVFRERELAAAATDLIERALDARTSLQTPVALLERATALGVDERFERHLRGSLNRWDPNQGVERLESLVGLAREEGLYSEIVLSVERWIRECEPDPEADHGPLVAAAIEGLLEGTDTGREDAIELYRRYLYPAESLYGVGANLFEAASASGQETVTEDVLAAYDTDAFVAGESDLETGLMAARAAERDGQWHEAFDIWTALLEDTPEQSVCRHAVENRLRVDDLERASEYIDRLETEFGAETRANQYRLLVRDRRNNARAVVDIVDSTDGIFEDPPSDRARELAMAYVESLANLGRWEALESFLDDESSLPKTDHRFYGRLSTLMQYVQDGGATDATTAIDVTERLLSAPMETTKLQLLLNLGVVRNVADTIRTENPDLDEQVDIVEGLIEILVSLHAERFIDQLEQAGVETERFERNLAEADLRRGGRQLLTDLEREARRAGITETH